MTDTPPAADAAPFIAPHFFASAFQILGVGTEFVVAAMQAQPVLRAGEMSEEVGAAPVMVLHLSPQAAKELAVILTGSVAKHEDQFGELRSPFLDAQKSGG